MKNHQKVSPIPRDSQSETEEAGDAEGSTPQAHAQPISHPPLELGNEKVKEWSPSYHHPAKK